MVNKPGNTSISKLDLLFKKSVDRLEERTKSRHSRSFLTTGFSNLDDLIGGWEPGELVIIGARPAMGKTSLLMSMAKEIVQQSDHAVGFISFETSVDHLMERIISSEARIPMSAIKKARIKDDEWNRVENALAKAGNDPLYIVENPDNSIEGIARIIEWLADQHKVSVVMLDYLQLIEGIRYRRNREQEVSSVIRELKKLARNLNIVIVAASQLNRSVELRSGAKQPVLADLRDSGAIEEDTDKVIFIHRPELYDIMEDERGNSLVGIAELIVAKNRTGPMGSIILRFDAGFGRFYGIDTDPAAFGDISPDDLPDYESPF